MKTLFALIISVVLSGQIQAQRRDIKEKSTQQKVKGLQLRQINPHTTYLSYEATFQTAEMAQSAAISTPFKHAKLDALVGQYLPLVKDEGKVLISAAAYRGEFPGKYFNFSDGEQANVNLEPGVIEWTFKPKKIFELVDAWAPVYAAAHLSGLTPYAFPIGRGGGGGHFHIGGTENQLNPFVLNPLLLRNLLVFYHNNPGILFGFSEAFDVGADTNSQTFHGRQSNLFFGTISWFDTWYEKT